jgi:hypothetical protein
VSSLVDLAGASAELASRRLARSLRAGVAGMKRLRSVGEAAARAGCAVHGVGVGPREVLGARTRELAIRAYVVQKLPRRELLLRDRVPASVDGVPVDVVESLPALLSNAGTPATPGKRKPADVLESGISVGCEAVPFGTLAAFCRSVRSADGDRVLVLSNHHVLAAPRGRAGDPVFQPGPADADGPLNPFGSLLRAFRVEPGDTPNRIDAAVAALNPGLVHTTTIPGGIGVLRGMREARINTAACKFGRTSGCTVGVVTDVHCSEVVGLDPQRPQHAALFVDQIRVDRGRDAATFAEKGDSGALVLETETGRAIGLYFAGPMDGSYGLANHIGAVLERLEIQLLTGV